jgi:hypothetical protein
MKLTTNFAMIAIASALLAPLVVGATAYAIPVEAPAVAEVAAAAPACARKVKVVYAAFGSTGCAPALILR